VNDGTDTTSLAGWTISDTTACATVPRGTLEPERARVVVASSG
jgi:hypothetical protein